MPCFNEAATVKAIAERVLASPYTKELIVVDDASEDGSAEVVRRIDDPRLRVLQQPVNRGKGAALRRGFGATTAPYLIVQDADLEYDPAEYGHLLDPLLKGDADVVYGSRFVSGRPHRVLYYWHSLGNRVLTTISNMFTNLNLSDMETCYKAFRREVLETLELEEDRFGFEPEFTAKVARAGWRVYEVGIAYSGRTYGEGKKIGWKDGAWALRCIVQYSWPWRRRNSGSASASRRPATAEESEMQLSGVLDSLEGAERYADWIFGLIRPYIGDRILEIGAGHGTFTRRLARHGQVTATEVSETCALRLLSQFRELPNVRVEMANLDQAALNGRHYDSAVLINVLEHIADDHSAVERLRDALVPGGRLVLYVPAFESLYSEFDRKIGHHRRYRAPELAALMEKSQLEVIDLRYVNILGAVGWWLLARQLRKTPTQGWPMKLFDRWIVPPMRRIEAAWPPPAGQSLLCVARRSQ
jgi:SAM-dependent methyltransferase